MSEPQWLTMEEAQLKFKVGEASIKKMIRVGQLQGMKIGRDAGGQGVWRILDVTPEFHQRQQEAAEHIVHVPLLSTAEVAEVLGTTVLYTQQLVAQRKIKPINPGKFSQTAKTKLFTVAEVRRYLFKKEKVKRAGRRVVKIDRLITWAKVLLDQQRREAAEGMVVKDEMLELIQQIMELPAQERMASLRDLWQKLDLIETMRLASEQPLTGEPEACPSETEGVAVSSSTPETGQALISESNYLRTDGGTSPLDRAP